MNYYSYIFVRADLIPEQVAVQASHVAFAAARDESFCRYAFENNIDLSVLNFVLIAAPEMEMAIDWATDYGSGKHVAFSDNGYRFEQGKLVEDPMHRVTAIMTYPIAENARGLLQYLPLLRFRSEIRFG